MIMPSLLSQSVPRTSSIFSTRLAVTRAEGFCVPVTWNCGGAMEGDGAGGFSFGSTAEGAVETGGVVVLGITAGAESAVSAEGATITRPGGPMVGASAPGAATG